MEQKKVTGTDEVGDPERVGHDGDGLCDLVGDLHRVMVDQPAEDDRPVERGDRLLGEEGGENVADKATDGVEGEEIQRIVGANEELWGQGEVGGSVGARSR